MSAEVRPEIKIRPAAFPADFDIVRKLFLAYAESLPIKLDFQGFEDELAGLPGKYDVQKGGAVYLAYARESSPQSASSSTPSIEGQSDSSQLDTNSQEQVIGCIALRPFTPPDACELKRLYLAPASRGLGVSKLLMDVIIAQARQLGYKEMLLDTLSSMTTARSLYARYGFEEIAEYYNSVEDAVFYRLVL